MTSVTITTQPAQVSVSNQKEASVSVTSQAVHVTVQSDRGEAGVRSVVAGRNVSVDAADPANPVIHADDKELADFNDDLALLYRIATL